MPWFFEGPRHKLLLAATLLLTFAAQGAGGIGQTQSVSQYPQTNPPQNGGRPAFGSDTDSSEDSMTRRSQLAAAKKRNVERQNKLAADSDRIVRLAQELSNAIQPTAMNPAQGGVGKKAEEIEKLARGIRERMKDG